MTARITISILLLACMAYSPALFTQRTVTWKGGAPGQETQWQCPKNWAGNHVPDEFSDVTIPDVSTRSMAYPVLKDMTGINSLRVESNAVLTITPEGQLTVYNDIFILHENNLQVKGALKVLNEGEAAEKVMAALLEQKKAN